jgi:hypothetical protein
VFYNGDNDSDGRCGWLLLAVAEGCGQRADDDDETARKIKMEKRPGYADEGGDGGVKDACSEKNRTTTLYASADAFNAFGLASKIMGYGRRNDFIVGAGLAALDDLGLAPSDPQSAGLIAAFRARMRGVTTRKSGRG